MSSVNGDKGHQDKIVILFVAANPIDTATLRVDAELREIQQRLKAAPQRDRFVMTQCLATRPADLTEAILEHRPTLVHFAGHGTPSGELCFEDETGTAKLIPNDALSALFAEVADHVDCVLLNACYSQSQAAAIAQSIPFVIGIKNEIDDKAGLAFTTGFYQALGVGNSIEQAYRLGCVQMRFHGFGQQALLLLSSLV